MEVPEPGYSVKYQFPASLHLPRPQKYNYDVYTPRHTQRYKRALPEKTEVYHSIYY